MNSKFEFPMKIVATYRPGVGRSFGIQQIHELLAIEWLITIGYESRAMRNSYSRMKFGGKQRNHLELTFFKWSDDLIRRGVIEGFLSQNLSSFFHPNIDGKQHLVGSPTGILRLY